MSFVLDGVVLLTGGAGFVGSRVVQELLARRTVTRVVVLDNLFNGRREHVPVDARVDFRQADLRDASAVERIVSETSPASVLHLAALHFIPYCDAHPAETLAVNVVGTQNLLDALRKSPPVSLVAASSAAVYSICDGPCREDDVVEPTDVYGLSKLTNERQLALFAAQTGARVAAARMFNVFGPNETNPHVVPEIVRQMTEGAASISLGNTKPKRDYVFTADMARALVATTEGALKGFRTYNVGTGVEHSVEDIVDELARISGQTIEIVTDPDRVRKLDRMHLLCDRTRIEREIGWRPQYTLARGLAELWAAAAGAKEPSPTAK